MYKRDLTGYPFGELKVLGPAAQDGYWNCKCSCGNTTTVYRGNLTTGRTKSCGHLRTQNLGRPSTTLPKFKQYKAIHVFSFMQSTDTSYPFVVLKTALEKQGVHVNPDNTFSVAGGPKYGPYKNQVHTLACALLASVYGEDIEHGDKAS